MKYIIKLDDEQIGYLKAMRSEFRLKGHIREEIARHILCHADGVIGYIDRQVKEQSKTMEEQKIYLYNSEEIQGIVVAHIMRERGIDPKDWKITSTFFINNDLEVIFTSK